MISGPHGPYVPPDCPPEDDNGSYSPRIYDDEARSLAATVPVRAVICWMFAAFVIGVLISRILP